MDKIPFTTTKLLPPKKPKVSMTTKRFMVKRRQEILTDIAESIRSNTKA